MITLEEGNKHMLPFVQVEIEPGRWPFQYWYEVSYWTPDNQIDGHKAPCWTHHWERDGGGFGLWFVMKKANHALHCTWFELVRKQKYGRDLTPEEIREIWKGK